MSPEAFRGLRSLPSIIHFTGKYKPWYYLWEPHYKRLYYGTLSLTPWREYHPPDRTPLQIFLKSIKMLYFRERVNWYKPGLA